MINLPPKPNPLDPCVPAVMMWAATDSDFYSHVPLLAYRKAKDQFFLGTNPLSPHAYWLAVETIVTLNTATYEWRRTSTKVTGYGVIRTLLNRPHLPPGYGEMRNRTPGAYLKGVRYAIPSHFKCNRDKYRAFAPLIKDALHAQEHGSYQEERDTYNECVTHANDELDNPHRGEFVEALRGAFDNHGRDCNVSMQDCGHAENDDDNISDHRGDTYCSDCADDLREIDGEYYSEDDCYYWDSDGEYHTEEEPEDEDEDENDENDEDEDSNLINSWGSSTARLAHDTFPQSPHSDFTMGVELEVECEGFNSRVRNEAAQDCHDHFNADERYAMFKKDGSLSDQGFEIVTAAQRLGEHLEKFGAWTPHPSLRAWKPGNCGVHVHIDSRAFSALTLGKFLMFINSNANIPLITAIAGRHPRNDSAAQSYCAQIDQEVLSDPLKVLKGNNNTRYRMVNLTNLGYEERGRLQVSNVDRDCKGNYSTVELRIFRASLKKERLLAQIEFSHAAVMFCRTASWHGLTGGDFKAWLATGAALQYKNLARWFGIRVPKADKRAPAPVRELEAECA